MTSIPPLAILQNAAREQWRELLPRLKGRTAGALGAASAWQASNYIIPLLTFPYLARTLGAEGFGVLGLATAITGYALLATDWGFNFTATQAAAHWRDDRGELNQLLWATVCAKGLLATFALGVMALLVSSQMFDRNFNLVLGSSMLSIVGAVLNVDWILRGTERLRQFAIASVLGRFTVVPLVYLLVQSPKDTAQAAAATSISSLITALFTLCAAWQSGFLKRPKVSVKAIKSQIAQGALIFFSTALISVYTNSLAVILGWFSGNLQVGLFVGADRIRKPIQGLYGPISMVFYSRINYLVKFDIAKAQRTCLAVLVAQGGLVLLLSLGTALAAPLLIQILLGPDFAGSIPILRLLSGVIAMVGVSNVFGQLIMLPFGMKREFTICISAGAISGLVLAIPLSLAWAAQGMAIAALVAETIVTLTMYLFLARKLDWFGIWRRA